MTEGERHRPSDEYQSDRNPIACAIETRLRARFSYYSAHHWRLLIFLAGGLCPDGDTIEVLQNNYGERLRLNGIDCPEKGQAYGKKAKQFTSTLVFGKEVTIKALDKDSHGRTVGDVLLPDGTNVSRELVKAGLAWWYRRYSKDKILAVLEWEARQTKRGLWADPHPVPPWEWRSREGERRVVVFFGDFL